MVKYSLGKIKKVLLYKSKQKMTLPRSYCQDKSVNLPMVSFDLDCVKVKKDMGFTVHTSGLQNYGKISLRKHKENPVVQIKQRMTLPRSCCQDKFVNLLMLSYD